MFSFLRAPGQEKWQTGWGAHLCPSDEVLCRGLPTEELWIWIGMGVLCFAIVLYNVLIWACHAFLHRKCPWSPLFAGVGTRRLTQEALRIGLTCTSLLQTRLLSASSQNAFAALEKPAVVLPLGLQELIADEAAAKEAAQNGRKEALQEPPEVRKMNERHARRASIAIGVMNSISSQGSFRPSSTLPHLDSVPKADLKKKPPRKTSLLKPSYYKAALDTSSSLNAILEAQTSTTIPAAGGTALWRYPVILVCVILPGSHISHVLQHII